MWPAMVFGPVIQSTVPSATVPASLSRRGPRAATSTGKPAPGVVSLMSALSVSPAYATFSPREAGMRMSRYSFMCRPGRSKL